MLNVYSGLLSSELMCFLHHYSVLM